MSAAPLSGVFKHRHPQKSISHRLLLAVGVVNSTLPPSPGPAEHVIHIWITCSASLLVIRPGEASFKITSFSYKTKARDLELRPQPQCAS